MKPVRDDISSRRAARACTFAIALAAMAHAPGACASTLQVPAGYATIQSAIVAALDGDVVRVSPGTYYEALDFLDKSITVESVAGAASTVIDAQSTAVAVTIVSPSRQPSALRGFTIRGGYGDRYAGIRGGGGVMTWAGAPTIENNVIVDNAGCQGGGIYVENAAARIQNNRIARNSLALCNGGLGGAGIYVTGYSASSRIVGNIIEDNEVGDAPPGLGSGAGIHVEGAGSATVVQRNIIRNNRGGMEGGGYAQDNQAYIEIEDNVVYGNTATYGGGLYIAPFEGSRGLRLVNNTIADNRGYTLGSEMYVDGFPADMVAANNVFSTSYGASSVYCDGLRSSVPPQLSYDDLWTTSGAAAGGTCASSFAGNGNIAVDPRFVPAGGTPYGIGRHSPLVDAGANALVGTVTVDVLKRPRIADGNGDQKAIVDIGAYELPAK